MIKLFAAYTDNLPEPQEQTSILNGLPQERQGRILKHRTKEGRKQSLGAGLLLKKVLEEYGISADEICTGENGKPVVSGICFNLSHSGNLVICAVSDSPVGCDAEKTGLARMKVAKRFFSKRENQYLDQFAEEEQDREFCRIWTMRESYVKMTGEGMRLDFGKFETLMMNDGTCQIIREGKKEACFLREYELEGYCISVCAKEEESAKEMSWVNLIS